MAGIRVEGNISGNVAEVDSNNNLKVTLPNTASQMGGVRMFCEKDPGDITGEAYLMSPDVSEDYRMRVAVDTLLFDDNFNIATLATQNSNKWRYVTTTMTCTVGSGSVLFNAISSTAAGNSTTWQTWKYFPLVGTSLLWVENVFAITATPLSGQVFESGLFLAQTASAPTEGAFFRITSAGLFGVVNYNGAETQTGVLIPASSIVVNKNYKYVIGIDSRHVEFWIDDVLYAEIDVPAGSSQTFISTALPFCMMQRNAGLISGSPHMQVKVGLVSIDLGDYSSNKPWAHQMVGNGLMSACSQNGVVMVATNNTQQTSNYTNSLAAGAGAAMTNTTAATGTGLGGQFAVQPTLTAGTDGILCSYLNPAGTAAITGRTLYVTGIRVQGAVTTVLANAGPVIYAYAVAFGHSALTMATIQDSATAKCARRFPIGYETYAINAAVGTLGSAGIDMQYVSPIVVEPGQYFAILAKNIGTVTTSGVITVLVTVNGYWE